MNARLHEMDTEYLLLIERLRQDLKEEKMIREDERQRARQREQGLHVKISALATDKEILQRQVEELNVSVSN